MTYTFNPFTSALDKVRCAVIDYFLKSEHISKSTGAADAGKPIILDDEGKLDSSLFSAEFGNLIPQQLDYDLTIPIKRQLIVAESMELEPTYSLAIEGSLHIIP